MVKEKYSFSKLSSFHTCPYGYYLTYVKKMSGEGNAFSSYGSLVHSILERWGRGELQCNELADTFEWEFPMEVTEEFPPNKYVDLKQSYYDQAMSYLSSFNGFDGIEILDVEKKFEIDIDDWVFNGIIDIVAKDKDGYVIIDHKSHKKFASKNEQAEYARQLYLYSIYIKDTYGEYPHTLIFNCFRGTGLVPIKWEQDSFSGTLEWARSTVNEIRNCFDFEPKCEDFYSKNLCNHRAYCEQKVDFSR